MRRKSLWAIASIVAVLLGMSTVTAQTRNSAAEAAAKKSLEAFITAWNTGENASLRKAMNFPFVTVGGGATTIANEPEDFSTDFDRMRQREGWARSSFDFDSYAVNKSSAEKVHCEIDFSRFQADGTRYLKGRVMYIVTNQNGHWAPQMRSPAVGTAPLGQQQRAEALAGARQAVLDFFTAFNAADTEGTTRHLNYPHVFMTLGGGFALAEDSSSRSVRPDFQRMRANQKWHTSTIDSLEASSVAASKVHMELVFSRWHPDGTRYWTVPALWLVTRVGDRWGIQLRSLMPATFSDLSD